MKQRIRVFSRANMKLLVVTSIAAISLIAVGVATPAVGGPSLKTIGKRLAAMQAQINALQNQQGRQGAQGVQGQSGPQGQPGPAGDNAIFEASNWGEINRNTIGSPVAALRPGPFGSFGVTGPSAAPPFGEGSLGISVADGATTATPPSEKAAFGNEVDFFGDPVLDLTAVGFRVFQTGENAAISARNMPNITFEIDPNMDADANTGSQYSSMTWVPDAAPVTNQWSGYIDATTTGDWYLTGAAGTATGCTQANMCEFAALKTALGNGGPAPTIYTAAVGKGRDNRWSGAVDGLRINSEVFDFEPLGVGVTAP